MDQLQQKNNEIIDLLIEKDDISKINLQIPGVCELIRQEFETMDQQIKRELTLMISLLILRNSSSFKGEGSQSGYDLETEILAELGNLKFLPPRLRRMLCELVLLDQETSVCLLDEEGAFGKRKLISISSFSFCR